MTLLEQIKQQLNSISTKQLIKNLGYHNVDKGEKILQRFLQSEDIAHWLESGYFDINHDSQSFLKALVISLNIPSFLAEDELTKYRQKQIQLRKLKQPYIFVDTGFKRVNQPIFALATLEGVRRINIDKSLYLQYSKKEIQDIISKLIIKHFKKHHGQLTIWGKIQQYVYHDTNGHEVCYTPDGIKLSRVDKIHLINITNEIKFLGLNLI